jgi:hypothetical protein
MRLGEHVGYVLKERVGDLTGLIDYMRRVQRGTAPSTTSSSAG